MLAAAVPIFSLHIGQSGVTTLPADMPSRAGYVALQQQFPAQQPVPGSDRRPGRRGRAWRLAKLEHTLAADPRFGTGGVRTGRDGISVLSVPIRGDAVGSAAVSAVRDLRAHLVPAAFAGSARGCTWAARRRRRSTTSTRSRTRRRTCSRSCSGSASSCCTIAFRSIVVALVSIALNLLSVAAAYGLLTLVSLHGVGAGLLGFQHVHTIDAWVPLFLFSVLFALSMDYQVFLMSRIKERYDESGSTREAVAPGISSTARIITGAALIIIIVFSGFAAGQLVMFQDD